ncbi:MAG: 16S rRNA processing protein RimM [Alphaproteobacteria bacterium]|jgi:16S rRNA processing protein RimM
MRRPDKKDGFFCVGVIATAHGIKGEVTFKTFIEKPEDILDYGTLVNMQDVPFSISNFKVTTKGLITRLEGVKTRNDAERLRGMYLYASNDMLPDLEDNMYVDDLIGTKVYREDGTLFGTIRNHFDNGAQTIIAVKIPEEGKRDVLLPFTDDVVLAVDQAAATITVSEMADEFAALDGNPEN